MTEEWKPEDWAPHKASEKPVKTWTSRTEQTYVIACVTCKTPWPCQAEFWRWDSVKLKEVMEEVYRYRFYNPGANQR